MDNFDFNNCALSNRKYNSICVDAISDDQVAKFLLRPLIFWCVRAALRELFQGCNRLLHALMPRPRIFRLLQKPQKARSSSSLARRVNTTAYFMGL